VISKIAPPTRETHRLIARAARLATYRGILFAFSAYLIGAHLWTWMLCLPPILGGHADFRQLYAAGYMVRSGHGHQLYDYASQVAVQNAVVSNIHRTLPFIRPAYESLLFVPLSLLPYRSAYFTFVLLSLVGLLACYWEFRPHFGDLGSIYPWLPGAIFLGFMPVTTALIQGQDSILLLLVLGASFNALHRNKSVLAGSLLALGLFKFQIILPIVFLFALWKQWRFVKGFLLSGVVLGAISAWIVGLHGIAVYPDSLIHLNYPLEVRLMPNLHGLASLLFGQWLGGRTVIFISILLAGAVFYLTWRSKPESSVDKFLVAIVAAVLGGYYLLAHDLTVLLLPIIVMLGRCLQIDAANEKLAWSAVLTFLVPHFLFYFYDGRYFCLAALPIAAFLLSMSSAAPYACVGKRVHDSGDFPDQMHADIRLVSRINGNDGRNCTISEQRTR
jgi:Glycosyltransferase family 87